MKFNMKLPKKDVGVSLEFFSSSSLPLFSLQNGRSIKIESNCSPQWRADPLGRCAGSWRQSGRVGLCSLRMMRCIEMWRFHPEFKLRLLVFFERKGTICGIILQSYAPRTGLFGINDSVSRYSLWLRLFFCS